MTILVGILCEDGAIVAADGMASLNLGATPFVGNNNLKVHVIENELIVACSGDDSLMTQFIHFLKSYYAENFKKKQRESFNLFESMKEIGFRFAHLLINTYKEYPVEFSKGFIHNVTVEGFPFGAIVALPFNDKHYVFMYDNFLMPKMLRDDGIWHAILGSGHLVANPSIHLVKKILNIHSKPRLDRGQILAYWTIDHAIEVSSGGIGGKITIAVLQKVNGVYKASVEDRIGEHKDFIEDIYKHIWNYEMNVSEEKSIKRIPSLTI